MFREGPGLTAGELRDNEDPGVAVCQFKGSEEVGDGPGECPYNDSVHLYSVPRQLNTKFMHMYMC